MSFFDDPRTLKSSNRETLFLNSISTHVKMNIRWIYGSIFHLYQNLIAAFHGRDRNIFQNRQPSVFLDMQHFHVMQLYQNILMKSKRQLLEERLDKLKKNSEELISRMDNKIEKMDHLKNDLNIKSNKLSNLQKNYENVIKIMAERLLGIKIRNNPLQPPVGDGEGPRVQSIPNVLKRLFQYKEVCILTGAGVSKDSGIPTFRGEDGFYTKYFEKGSQKLTPEKFLTYENFLQNPDLIWKWYDEFCQLLVGKKPCENHYLIHRLCQILSKKGLKVTLLTTNIDGFHYQVSKNFNYKIQEIHGNLRCYLCQKCSHQQYAIKRKEFKCQECKYELCRPNIMFFDERYGEIFMRNSIDSIPFVFAIGTSLQTGFSFKLVSDAKEVVEINPRCAIKSGKVYQFEEECTNVLKRFCQQLQK